MHQHIDKLGVKSAGFPQSSAKEAWVWLLDGPDQEMQSNS